MAIYGNLKDYRFDSDAEDIRGADVYGSNDEKLGEIEDVIFDSRSGELNYVVIDTGGWLSSQRFLVPAREIMIREEGDEDYRVNLTREQIERFPEYNEEALASEERWADYERRYHAAMDDGPVMHREDSTRMITPEPSAASDSRSFDSGRVDPAAATPRRIGQDLPRFGATSQADTMSPEVGGLVGNTQYEPAGAIPDRNERRGPERGRRFEDFQERLRREREEILRRRAA